MNNLNDPPNWNILPNRRGPGDDGSRWNYALLVPMLGLAAFREYGRARPQGSRGRAGTGPGPGWGRPRPPCKLQCTELSPEKGPQDGLESPEVTAPDVADVFIYWAQRVLHAVPASETSSFFLCGFIFLL